MSSITADSSRKWIYEHELSLFNYLSDFHDEEDHDRVTHLIYHLFPDEGKKLIQNYNLTQAEKITSLIKWIVHSPQITCLILGDQRMGKDALVCRLFELIIDYCKINDLKPPRFVTLGNVKCPPFVAPRDMYFDFMDIPFGTSEQPVYIYSSELEAEFPAREFASEDNKAFSSVEGVMAQNHQKLFGCIKLASKVDIAVLRSCNVKLFKYISPEKLNLVGVERINVLSDLGKWFLPKDINNKSECLMAFDNNLLTADFNLPDFWSDEYSEQFRGGVITREQLYSYVKSKLPDSEKLTPASIRDLQRRVRNKFRVLLSPEEVRKCFDL